MKMFLRIGPAMGPPNGVEARMGVFVAQNSAAARLLEQPCAKQGSTATKAPIPAIWEHRKALH